MTEITRYASTGIAPIKAEYRLAGGSRADRRDDDAAEASTNPATQTDGEVSGEPATKRIKLDTSSNSTEASARTQGDSRDGKKARRKGGGQNKGRTFNKIQDPASICFAFASGEVCKAGESCKFSHDIAAYLAVKPRDIWVAPFPEARLRDLEGKVYEGSQTLPPIQIGSLWHLSEPVRSQVLDSVYSTEEPFIKAPGASDDTGRSSTEPSVSSLDSKTFCPDYASRGTCKAGFKCRFLGAHARSGGLAEHGGVTLVQSAVQKRKQTESLAKIGRVASEGDHNVLPPEESNVVNPSHQKLVRKKKYPLPATREVLALLDREQVDEKGQGENLGTRKWGRIYLDRTALNREADEQLVKELEAMEVAQKPTPKQRKGPHGEPSEVDLDDLENAAMNSDVPIKHQVLAYSQAEIDASPEGSIDLARFRPSEKRRLAWAGKLYLAPLTTTGNLPFRRICSTFGSDIHCGEMGLAESFLEGGSKEWSLVKRWEGERIFGTQVCGSKPDLLIPTAEALMREVGHGLDFVDVNCGCPIDLVFKRGAGSALLDHTAKLGRILRGMEAVLGDIPLTIKLRTGTSSSKNTTHKLFPRLQTEFGVSAATMHGRSRKQRYRKLADWDYIRACADSLRAGVQAHNEEAAHADEPEMVPIPIFGNGDVYGPTHYYDNLEKTGVDGEMIARGALIKPWIFSEIKERRDWDISSRERLDMIRQFASYGLSHWGSDTQGVNTTRRFLCEALSFQYRYVPIGLLEHLPAHMNDRPPAFRGRDSLETLLASGDSRDWVRLSEMFLGPAPDEWNFLPKHKSNSYGTEEGQEDQG